MSEFYSHFFRENFREIKFSGLPWNTHYRQFLHYPNHSDGKTKLNGMYVFFTFRHFLTMSHFQNSEEGSILASFIFSADHFDQSVGCIFTIYSMLID